MSGVVTNLHYAPNSNFNGNTYAPGADGFNLADVDELSQVNSLPTGVKGLVWLGDTSGATASFEATVNQYVGNSNVYGFYLADEPGPDVSAVNLKAEADYIHSVDPGAVTFIVLENNGTPTAPSYSFNPANTDIDLFGLDPYPIMPQFTNGADYSVIGDAVNAAEAEGVPQSAIVPVYQAFGATSGPYSSWTLPTTSQEQTILSTWAQYTPTPAFDYAYSWGVQDGDTALSDDPALQAVFAAHNAGSTSGSSDVLTPDATAIIAVVGQSFSATVATFTDSNTSITSGELSATIDWGDGTTSLGTVTGSGGSFAVTGSHTYSAAGSDKVAVTLSEDPPATATATADSTATVEPASASTVLTATDRAGITANVPVIASGSSSTTVGEGIVYQFVRAGVDTVSFARVTSETLQLGSGTRSMSFVSPGSLTATGGSGSDTITTNRGHNTFIAGTGSLDVTGGSAYDSYVFHAGDGLLTIQDFSATRDSLTVDKSLQGSFHEASDGRGGIMLTFGTPGSGIALVGVSSLPESTIHFV